jgi:predicted ATPase/DNA-binding CsgD family transcriptional regulator
VHIEQTVAAAFGLTDYSGERPRDALTAHLRDRHCLLVMDNCEHLAGDVGSLIYDLLRVAPDLHVLATSREMLGNVGEHVVHVPPLVVPEAFDPSRNPSGEALELLRLRAAAVGAPIATGDVGAAAELCRRLEGLPLAIELAAGRLPALSVSSVLDRLDNRFQLLTGGSPYGQATHQSFQQVLDWSYQLCSEPESRLWERVSVFTGGFELRAVEEVCSGDGVEQGEVLDLISGLVRRSLLIVDRRSPYLRSRYRILETLRQYGLRILSERGDERTFRERHRDYYRRMAASAALDWYSSRELEWLEWTRTDLTNLRSAMSYSHDNGSAVIITEMAINIFKLRGWLFIGWPGEGRTWLQRALELEMNPSNPLRVMATVLTGVINLFLGDTQTANAMLAEVRAAVGGQEEFSPVLGMLEGLHALFVEADPISPSMLKRVIDSFQEHGVPAADVAMLEQLWAIGSSFCSSGDVALAASQRHLENALSRGAEWEISWAKFGVGLAHIRRGDTPRALSFIRESIRLQQDMNDQWGIAWGTHSVAWALAGDLTESRNADPRKAADVAEQIARVLGGAQRLRERLGVRLEGMMPFHNATIAAEEAAQRVLGQSSYAQAFEQGSCRHLGDSHGFQQIYATALGEHLARDGKPEKRLEVPIGDSLTPREREVSELVSQGLSNLQIARKMMISDRTVQTHVGNILNKRGLRNRQEIAVWFTRAKSDTQHPAQ